MMSASKASKIIGEVASVRGPGEYGAIIELTGKRRKRDLRAVKDPEDVRRKEWGEKSRGINHR